MAPNAKQRLVAAAQRAFVGRAPDLDMGHRAVAPVREPSAAMRTAADRVLACGQGQDGFRDRPLRCQIRPGWVAALNGGPPGPAFGRTGAGFGRRSRDARREARNHAYEAPQHLADLAEAERRFEVPDEVEHVAFGVAGRVPPAAPVMVDDDDLALAAAVFQRPSRALARIQSPAGELLEHGGAAHAAPEQIQFRIARQHRLLSGIGAGVPGRASCPALFRSRTARPDGREAGGPQGRSRRWPGRSPGAAPCGAAGASGRRAFG